MAIRSFTTDFGFGATASLAQPAGSIVGDVLVLFLQNAPSGTGAGSTATVTTPSGFALVDSISINDQLHSGTHRNIAGGVYYRVLTGGETWPLSATGGGSNVSGPAMSAILVALSGRNTIAPIAGHSSNSGDSTSSTLTALSVAAYSPNTDLLVCPFTWETDRGPFSGTTEFVNSAGNGITGDSAVISSASGNLTCSSSATETWVALAVSVNSTQICVRQSAQTTATATGTALAQAYTSAVAAGSTLNCFVECLDATSETISVSDSVNGSWGSAVQLVNDGTKTVAQFQFPSTAAGTPTVTATFGVTTTLRAIWIQEVMNAAAASIDGFNGQTQASPGAGTDAITSGAATNTKQPALVLALSSDHRTVSPVAPAAGTGYTDNGAGWTFAGGNQARLESNRVTASAPVAATFTGTSGVVPTTLMAVFDELGATGAAVASPPGIAAARPRALGYPYKSILPVTEVVDIPILGQGILLGVAAPAQQPAAIIPAAFAIPQPKSVSSYPSKTQSPPLSILGSGLLTQSVAAIPLSGTSSITFGSTSKMVAPYPAPFATPQPITSTAYPAKLPIPGLPSIGVGILAPATASVMLSGSSSITFASTSASTASGTGAGTSAILFDGSTTSATAAGALSGSAAVTFASTSAASGTGAASATGTITFGSASSSTGSGAGSATGAITFGSMSAPTGSGAAAGSSAITFDGSTTAAADNGVLAGGIAITFTASITNTVAVSTTFARAPPPVLSVFPGSVRVPGLPAIGNGILSPSAPLVILSGSANITFASAVTLADNGAPQGQDGITFASTSAATSSGALADSAAAITFGSVSTPNSNGVAIGSAAIVFGSTANGLGSGAAACTGAITFGSSCSPTGTGAPTGSAAVTFSSATSVTDNGVCVGSSAITFGSTSVATGSASAVGTDGITFGSTTVATDNGVLTGTAAIAFGGQLISTGNASAAFATPQTISRAPYPANKLGPATPFVGRGFLSPTAAPLVLSGSSAITLASTVSLTDNGAAIGSSAIAFGSTSALSGSGALVDSAAIVFGSTCASSANGTAAGTGSATFGSSASPTDTGSLAGSASITFSGQITGAALIGSVAISFGSSAALAATGAAATQSSVVTTANALANANGVLGATSGAQFGSIASVHVTAICSGTGTITISQHALLTQGVIFAPAGITRQTALFPCTVDTRYSQLFQCTIDGRYSEEFQAD